MVMFESKEVTAMSSKLVEAWLRYEVSTSTSTPLDLTSRVNQRNAYGRVRLDVVMEGMVHLFHDSRIKRMWNIPVLFG